MKIIYINADTVVRRICNQFILLKWLQSKTLLLAKIHVNSFIMNNSWKDWPTLKIVLKECSLRIVKLNSLNWIQVIYSHII